MEKLNVKGNTATVVNFPPVFDALAKDYAELARIVEDAKQEMDRIKARIIELMGDAEEISGAEHKASYKAVTSTRFDAQACKKDFPELYDAYGKTVTSYRFTFK